MSDKKKVAKALLQAEKESKNSPNETTGCCTISAGGWSEQKPGITKAACDKQKGPGVTVTWKEGAC
ncbi:hypothetical protein [Fodinibius roseus]|uniref:hypothetical protein n=1 Tax=Fodinibius roseus TaxID=1194090 RepID=UPI000934A0CE|nr:hypothetical protein [Fodinibius roseus]